MASNISVYVVSAICGNMWQESGINSGIWESLQVGTWTDLNKGFGLGQWTNTGGDTHGRLYKLNEWLTQNGYSDDSFYGQLDYIEVEDVWFRRGEAFKYVDLQGFLTSQSTDLTDLTHAWNIGWEGIHDASWNARVQYANDVLQYIQVNYDPSQTYTPVINNSYLSNYDRFNNAMCMYDYWNGGTPSPDPPTPSKKKGMPLFMYLNPFL